MAVRSSRWWGTIAAVPWNQGLIRNVLSGICSRCELWQPLQVLPIAVEEVLAFARSFSFNAAAVAAEASRAAFAASRASFVLERSQNVSISRNKPSSFAASLAAAPAAFNSRFLFRLVKAAWIAFINWS